MRPRGRCSLCRRRREAGGTETTAVHRRLPADVGSVNGPGRRPEVGARPLFLLLPERKRMPLRYPPALLLVTFVLLVLACAAPVPPPPPPPPPPPNNPAGPENPPPPVAVPNVPVIRDPAKEKPDLVWTADELRKEAKANGLHFRRQYKDKIIEVSGKLWDFEPFAYYAPNKLINVQL